MGFFSKIIDGINSFSQDMSNSFSTDATCSKCILCKQCIKTLSDGKQVRIFTCPNPMVDESVHTNIIIQEKLPPTINSTVKYKEAYQENRDYIFNYLSSSTLLNSSAFKPIKKEDYSPILTFEELKYCYRAMECPLFRGYIDNENCLNHNIFLEHNYVPNMDIKTFNSLSEEDKQKIMLD